MKKGAARAGGAITRPLRVRCGQGAGEGTVGEGEGGGEGTGRGGSGLEEGEVGERGGGGVEEEGKKDGSQGMESCRKKAGYSG